MTPVVRLGTTQSTNADALAFAREGKGAPLWVVAREQAGGRGRRGRIWHSPPGNLYASLVLRAPCEAHIAPQLGFVAGVALIDAIEALGSATTIGNASGDRHVRLKWPNDVLSGVGAKLAGILLEATRLADGSFVCTIGIGVNCRSFPENLPYEATSLSVLAGGDVAPDDLLEHLDRALIPWLARWNAGQNFAEIRAAWLERAVGVGGPVSTMLKDQMIEGVFETIDSTGRMVVRTNAGPVAIDAGDINFGAPAQVLVPA